MKHPVLKPSGIIRRSAFADYLRTLAPHLGFQLESPDFIASRDRGNGLHIRRRRAIPPTSIGLVLEFQDQWAYAFICQGILNDDFEPFSASNVVEHWTNGDITYTSTQEDPGPHIHNPSTSAHECTSVVNTNDIEDGFDYGSLDTTEDREYTGPITDDLKALALANVEVDGAAYTAQSWTWLSDVPPPTGIAQDLGYYDDGSSISVLTGVYIHSIRYRWVATGDYDLEIDWTQGGAAINETISPGTPGAWHDDEIPATYGVHDTISAVTITLA